MTAVICCSAIVLITLVALIGVYRVYTVTSQNFPIAMDGSLYDDGIPPRFFITGDKHRNFKLVKRFCAQMLTRKKDVLIILGDSGFNYFEDYRDDELKTEIARLNITLFCVHGNKENRPCNINTYGIRNFYGGKVYYEPGYPNILFAMDGEIYNFGGRDYLVIGGAHSVDKQRCLEESLPYWEDEMPSDEIKLSVCRKLHERNNKIYGLLTHTCPYKYIPTEMFTRTRQDAAKRKKKSIISNKKRKRLYRILTVQLKYGLISLNKISSTAIGFAAITM